VLLIIKVSDTSIEYDRTVKLPLYARAGIPEVWLANLLKDSVELFSQPLNDEYRDLREAKRGELLTSARIPDIIVSVDEILG
jgi:Uma2 family endonuclease